MMPIAAQWGPLSRENRGHLSDEIDRAAVRRFCFDRFDDSADLLTTL
jgi:hypothetical protein